ncbi:SET domain-containing protein [Babesia caballi]|uniref:[histone H3]-lysine(4) N-trimethyltransferase n=1 Tax=Babesia caballi TaxID=5871 RepID=A0AAV4LQI0_BABCB|nr:SET domain-containing protein [Babesia caballi]
MKRAKARSATSAIPSSDAAPHGADAGPTSSPVEEVAAAPAEPSTATGPFSGEIQAATPLGNSSDDETRSASPSRDADRLIVPAAEGAASPLPAAAGDFSSHSDSSAPPDSAEQPTARLDNIPSPVIAGEGAAGGVDSPDSPPPERAGDHSGCSRPGDQVTIDNGELGTPNAVDSMEDIVVSAEVPEKAGDGDYDKATLHSLPGSRQSGDSLVPIASPPSYSSNHAKIRRLDVGESASFQLKDRFLFSLVCSSPEAPRGLRPSTYLDAVGEVIIFEGIYAVRDFASSENCVTYSKVGDFSSHVAASLPPFPDGNHSQGPEGFTKSLENKPPGGYHSVVPLAHVLQDVALFEEQGAYYMCVVFRCFNARQFRFTAEHTRDVGHRATCNFYRVSCYSCRDPIASLASGDPATGSARKQAGASDAPGTTEEPSNQQKGDDDSSKTLQTSQAGLTGLDPPQPSPFLLDTAASWGHHAPSGAQQDDIDPSSSPAANRYLGLVLPMVSGVIIPTLRDLGSGKNLYMFDETLIKDGAGQLTELRNRILSDSPAAGTTPKLDIPIELCCRPSTHASNLQCSCAACCLVKELITGGGAPSIGSSSNKDCPTILTSDDGRTYFRINASQLLADHEDQDRSTTPSTTTMPPPISPALSTPANPPPTPSNAPSIKTPGSKAKAAAQPKSPGSKKAAPNRSAWLRKSPRLWKAEICDDEDFTATLGVASPPSQGSQSDGNKGASKSSVATPAKDSTNVSKPSDISHDKRRSSTQEKSSEGTSTVKSQKEPADPHKVADMSGSSVTKSSADSTFGTGGGSGVADVLSSDKKGDSTPTTKTEQNKAAHFPETHGNGALKTSKGGTTAPSESSACQLPVGSVGVSSFETTKTDPLPATGLAHAEKTLFPAESTSLVYLDSNVPTPQSGKDADAGLITHRSDKQPSTPTAASSRKAGVEASPRTPAHEKSPKRPASTETRTSKYPKRTPSQQGLSPYSSCATPRNTSGQESAKSEWKGETFVEIVEENDGFQYIGCCIRYRQINAPNTDSKGREQKKPQKTSNAWKYAVVKFWDPKWHVLFVHHLKDSLCHGLKGKDVAHLLRSQPLDDLLDTFTAWIETYTYEVYVLNCGKIAQPYGWSDATKPPRKKADQKAAKGEQKPGATFNRKHNKENPSSATATTDSIPARNPTVDNKDPLARNDSSKPSAETAGRVHAGGNNTVQHPADTTYLPNEAIAYSDSKRLEPTRTPTKRVQDVLPLEAGGPSSALQDPAAAMGACAAVPGLSDPERQVQDNVESGVHQTAVRCNVCGERITCFDDELSRNDSAEVIRHDDTLSFAELVQSLLKIMEHPNASFNTPIHSQYTAMYEVGHLDEWQVAYLLESNMDIVRLVMGKMLTDSLPLCNRFTAALCIKVILWLRYVSGFKQQITPDTRFRVAYWGVRCADCGKAYHSKCLPYFHLSRGPPWLDPDHVKRRHTHHRNMCRLYRSFAVMKPGGVSINHYRSDYCKNGRGDLSEYVATLCSEFPQGLVPVVPENWQCTLNPPSSGSARGSRLSRLRRSISRSDRSPTNGEKELSAHASFHQTALLSPNTSEAQLPSTEIQPSSEPKSSERFLPTEDQTPERITITPRNALALSTIDSATISEDSRPDTVGGLPLNPPNSNEPGPQTDDAFVTAPRGDPLDATVVADQPPILVPYFKHEDRQPWKCEDCTVCMYCYKPVSIVVEEPANSNDVITLMHNGRRSPYDLMYPTTLTEKLDRLNVKPKSRQQIDFVRCVSCNVSAHKTCCNPPIPDLAFLESWRCGSCLQCICCGYRDFVAPDYMNWGLFFLFCLRCWQSFEKNNYCGVCYRIWTPLDNAAHHWVQCDGCRLWVHNECDPFAQEISLAVTNKSRKYTCLVCRSSNKLNRILRVLELVFNSERSTQFRYPVPHTCNVYWRIVKCPMDLITIRTKLECGAYQTVEEFVFDVLVVTYNSKTVNMPNTRMYRVASNFELRCKQLISSILGLGESEMASILERGLHQAKLEILRGKMTMLTSDPEGDSQLPLSLEEAALRFEEIGQLVSDDLKAQLDLEDVGVTLNLKRKSHIFRTRHYQQMQLKRLEGILKHLDYQSLLAHLGYPDFFFEVTALCTMLPVPVVPCGLQYPMLTALSPVNAPDFRLSVSHQRGESLALLVESKTVVLFDPSLVQSPFDSEVLHVSDRCFMDAMRALCTDAVLYADDSWVEFCVVCGSSAFGAYLLFCQGCGEAFHYYCVGLAFPPAFAEYASFSCARCAVCECCSCRVVSNHVYDVGNVNDFKFAHALGWVPGLVNCTNFKLSKALFTDLKLLNSVNAMYKRPDVRLVSSATLPRPVDVPEAGDQSVATGYVKAVSELLEYNGASAPCLARKPFGGAQHPLRPADACEVRIPSPCVFLPGSKFPLYNVRCVVCGTASHLRCVTESDSKGLGKAAGTGVSVGHPSVFPHILRKPGHRGDSGMPATAEARFPFKGERPLGFALDGTVISAGPLPAWGRNATSTPARSIRFLHEEEARPHSQPSAPFVSVPASYGAPPGVTGVGSVGYTVFSSDGPSPSTQGGHTLRSNTSSESLHTPRSSVSHGQSLVDSSASSLVSVLDDRAIRSSDSRNALIRTPVRVSHPYVGDVRSAPMDYHNPRADFTPSVHMGPVAVGTPSTGRDFVNPGSGQSAFSPAFPGQLPVDKYVQCVGAAPPHGRQVVLSYGEPPSMDASAHSQTPHRFSLSVPSTSVSTPVRCNVKYNSRVGSSLQYGAAGPANSQVFHVVGAPAGCGVGALEGPHSEPPSAYGTVKVTDPVYPMPVFERPDPYLRPPAFGAATPAMGSSGKPRTKRGARSPSGHKLSRRKRGSKAASDWQDNSATSAHKADQSDLGTATNSQVTDGSEISSENTTPSNALQGSGYTAVAGPLPYPLHMRPPTEAGAATEAPPTQLYTPSQLAAEALPTKNEYSAPDRNNGGGIAGGCSTSQVASTSRWEFDGSGLFMCPSDVTTDLSTQYGSFNYPHQGLFTICRFPSDDLLLKTVLNFGGGAAAREATEDGAKMEYTDLTHVDHCDSTGIRYSVGINCKCVCCGVPVRSFSGADAPSSAELDDSTIVIEKPSPIQVPSYMGRYAMCGQCKAWRAAFKYDGSEQTSRDFLSSAEVQDGHPGETGTGTGTGTSDVRPHDDLTLLFSTDVLKAVSMVRYWNLLSKNFIKYMAIVVVHQMLLRARRSTVSGRRLTMISVIVMRFLQTDIFKDPANRARLYSAMTHSPLSPTAFAFWANALCNGDPSDTSLDDLFNRPSREYSDACNKASRQKPARSLDAPAVTSAVSASDPQMAVPTSLQEKMVSGPHSGAEPPAVPGQGAVMPPVLLTGPAPPPGASVVQPAGPGGPVEPILVRHAQAPVPVDRSGVVIRDARSGVMTKYPSAEDTPIQVMNVAMPGPGHQLQQVHLRHSHSLPSASRGGNVALAASAVGVESIPYGQVPDAGMSAQVFAGTPVVAVPVVRVGVTELAQGSSATTYYPANSAENVRYLPAGSRSFTEALPEELKPEVAYRAVQGNEFWQPARVSFDGYSHPGSLENAGQQAAMVAAVRPAVGDAAHILPSPAAMPLVVEGGVSQRHMAKLLWCYIRVLLKATRLLALHKHVSRGGAAAAPPEQQKLDLGCLAPAPAPDRTFYRLREKWLQFVDYFHQGNRQGLPDYQGVAHPYLQQHLAHIAYTTSAAYRETFSRALGLCGLGSAASLQPPLTTLPSIVHNLSFEASTLMWLTRLCGDYLDRGNISRLLRQCDAALLECDKHVYHSNRSAYLSHYVSHANQATPESLCAKGNPQPGDSKWSGSSAPRQGNAEEVRENLAHRQTNLKPLFRHVDKTKDRLDAAFGCTFPTALRGRTVEQWLRLGASLVVETVSSRAICGDVDVESFRGILEKSCLCGSFESLSEHDAKFDDCFALGGDRGGPNAAAPQLRPLNVVEKVLPRRVIVGTSPGAVRHVLATQEVRSCVLCTVACTTLLRGALLPWRDGFIHSECLLWSLDNAYLPRTYNQHFDTFLLSSCVLKTCLFGIQPDDIANVLNRRTRVGTPNSKEEQAQVPEPEPVETSMFNMNLCDLRVLPPVTLPDATVDDIVALSHATLCSWCREYGATVCCSGRKCEVKLHLVCAFLSANPQLSSHLVQLRRENARKQESVKELFPVRIYYTRRLLWCAPCFRDVVVNKLDPMAIDYLIGLDRLQMKNFLALEGLASSASLIACRQVLQSVRIVPDLIPFSEVDVFIEESEHEYAELQTEIRRRLSLITNDGRLRFLIDSIVKPRCPDGHMLTSVPGDLWSCKCNAVRPLEMRHYFSFTLCSSSVSPFSSLRVPHYALPSHAAFGPLCYRPASSAGSAEGAHQWPDRTQVQRGASPHGGDANRPRATGEDGDAMNPPKRPKAAGLSEAQVSHGASASALGEQDTVVGSIATVGDGGNVDMDVDEDIDSKALPEPSELESEVAGTTALGVVPKTGGSHHKSSDVMPVLKLKHDPLARMAFMRQWKLRKLKLAAAQSKVIEGIAGEADVCREPKEVEMDGSQMSGGEGASATVGKTTAPGVGVPTSIKEEPATPTSEEDVRVSPVGRLEEHSLVRIGSLTLLSVGDGLIFDQVNRAYPVGFTSIRLFWNANYVAIKTAKECRAIASRMLADVANRAEVRSCYLCTVRVRDGKPHFAVGILVGDDKSGCRWIAEGDDLDSVFFVFLRVLGMSEDQRFSGADFFGLSLHYVVQEIRMRLGRAVVARSLSFFNARFFYTALVGQTFSKRANKLKPMVRYGDSECLGQDGGEAAEVAHEIGAVIDFMGEHPFRVDGNEPKQLRARRRRPYDGQTPAAQYRYLNSLDASKRLEVRNSPIHGFGLFVKDHIAAGEPVVEYVGELIRDLVADRREEVYAKEQGGDGSCYMFRVDEHLIVDATRMGSMSRFINHSCQPNCFCRVVTCDNNQKHIIVFAKVDLHVGDEVTYDYQFGVEDETQKLRCLLALQAPPMSARAASLRFEGGVDGNDAPSEVAIGDQGVADSGEHVRQLLLVGEAPYGVDEVLVSASVVCDVVPQPGDDEVGVRLVQRAEDVVLAVAELQDHEPAAGLQHTVALPEPLLPVAEVAHPEGHRDEVEGVVRPRQAFRGRVLPRDGAPEAQVGRVLLPNVRHLHGRVDDRDVRGGAQRRAVQDEPGRVPDAHLPRPFEEAERDVSGAPCEIQDLHHGIAFVAPPFEGGGCDAVVDFAQGGERLLDEGVLPQPVDAQAHEVVHEVVPGGDVREDRADEFGGVGRGVAPGVAQGGEAPGSERCAPNATPRGAQHIYDSHRLLFTVTSELVRGSRWKAGAPSGGPRCSKCVLTTNYWSPTLTRLCTDAYADDDVSVHPGAHDDGRSHSCEVVCDDAVVVAELVRVAQVKGLGAVLEVPVDEVTRLDGADPGAAAHHHPRVRGVLLPEVPLDLVVRRHRLNRGVLHEVPAGHHLYGPVAAAPAAVVFAALVGSVSAATANSLACSGSTGSAPSLGTLVRFCCSSTVETRRRPGAAARRCASGLLGLTENRTPWSHIDVTFSSSLRCVPTCVFVTHSATSSPVLRSSFSTFTVAPPNGNTGLLLSAPGTNALAITCTLAFSKSGCGGAGLAWPALTVILPEVLSRVAVRNTSRVDLPTATSNGPTSLRSSKTVVSLALVCFEASGFLVRFDADLPLDPLEGPFPFEAGFSAASSSVLTRFPAGVMHTSVLFRPASEENVRFATWRRACSDASASSSHELQLNVCVLCFSLGWHGVYEYVLSVSVGAPEGEVRISGIHVARRSLWHGHIGEIHGQPFVLYAEVVGQLISEEPRDGRFEGRRHVFHALQPEQVSAQFKFLTVL